MQIFKTHDAGEAGVTVGNPPNQVTIRAPEYADDAALADEDVSNASTRISAIAAGSRRDASMEISIPKIKAMHIHNISDSECWKQQNNRVLNTFAQSAKEIFPAKEV